MRSLFVSFLLVSAAAAFDINPSQPSIGANGIVNAASYLSPGFSNYGIARGSLFLIFGVHLGPDTLVQAAYPLPRSEGLSGTRVHIDAPGYSGEAIMVYTSAQQVAAILPSNVPEGNATITLNYGNLSSNPVSIRVVRSAFGMFTLNQAGNGQAIAQNFVSQSQTPVNTVLASATPGQTMILWGTGLGPVSGDEASGPLPVAVPGLDALLVGGLPANVRYSGRSGCCAGIDQIAFDVPAGVSGCYVPIVALSSGVASNFGTIAVSNSGRECDDPLSFRASDLELFARNPRLRIGSVSLWNQTPPGATVGSDTLSASFASYSQQALPAAQAAVTPSAGSCYATELPVTADQPLQPRGDGLNAGFNVTATGPVTVTAENVSPGNYTGSTSAPLPPGVYTLSGNGGPDIAAFRGTFTVPGPVQWSNTADYPATIRTGDAMTFRWTGGDPGSFVAIRLASQGVTIATSITCNVPASLGNFTVPDYITRLLVQGEGSVSVGSFAPASFQAAGLDAGSVTAGVATAVKTSFRTPPQ